MPAQLTLEIISPSQDESEELASFIGKLIEPYLGESSIALLESGRWVDILEDED